MSNEWDAEFNEWLRRQDPEMLDNRVQDEPSVVTAEDECALLREGIAYLESSLCWQDGRIHTLIRQRNGAREAARDWRTATVVLALVIAGLGIFEIAMRWYWR